MQCTYNVTVRRVGATMVAVDKNYVLHILSVFVTLFNNYFMGKSRIILPSVVCPPLP